MASSKFEKAFASARKSGKKEFSFGGKSYNTKLKDDGPKNVPTPKARPVGAKASASASKGTEAKASTSAEAKSKKVFTLDKPKSYTERSKESASSTKKSTGSKPAFQLGPKTASYADRNKADDEKKKKTKTGGGGGY